MMIYSITFINGVMDRILFVSYFTSIIIKFIES